MAANYRERRRAATLRDITDVAMRHLAEGGVQGLSLRAVARELGMGVQSLYHYVASRDDLITALVTDAHAAVADAVAAAADREPPDDPWARLRAGVLAYRGWALAHRQEFGLIYGPPLAGYAAPPEGPTTEAAQRTSELFATLLGAARRRGLVTGDDAALQDLLIDYYGYLHGLVSLEAFGHLDHMGVRDVPERLVRQLDAHRREP